jgi:hypothetical protein
MSSEMRCSKPIPIVPLFPYIYDDHPTNLLVPVATF